MMLTTATLACLPAEARSHVQLWTARMQTLMALGRGWTRHAKTLAAEWGVSEATVVRYYYLFEAEGPTGLINKKKYGKYLGHGEVRGLPEPFLEYWKGLNERFQRNGGARQSYRVLMDALRQWRKGNPAAAIPGYSEPPRNQTGQLHPKGWSYENLTRHVSHLTELTLARQGRGKAKALLPKVYTTRVGLEVGQVIVPDDQEHDINIAWDSIGQVARPMSFNLMDLLSGYEIIDGYQPKLTRADGTRMGLKEEDLFWMFLTHFTDNGYRADVGTWAIVERGSATLRAELAKGFADASNGKIIVEKGGVDNRPLKGLLYDGPARGNFRFKASRESVFNLWRNMVAALPGATGRNRDESPEEHQAIIKYCDKLLKRVPEERRHLIDFHILTEAQFIALMRDLRNALNERTWHNLEGWRELGFTRTMFRLPEWGDDQFVPIEEMQKQLLTLPPDRAELLSLAFASQSQSEKLIVQRNLSPREVWDAGKKHLTKLSPWAWNLAIPARLAHTRHVEDNREILIYGGPQVLRYDARARSATGRDIMLRPGEQFLVYVNPLAPDTALCCDTTGAAVGLLHRIVPMTKIDHAGVIRRLGEVRQMTADIEAPVARRAESLAQERKEQQEHNDRVLQGLPVTPAEHEARTRRKATQREATSIFDHAPSAPVLPEPSSPPEISLF